MVQGLLRGWVSLVLVGVAWGVAPAQAEPVGRVELRIFAMSWCGPCHAYARMLEQRGWEREFTVESRVDGRRYRVEVRRVVIDETGYPDAHRPRTGGVPESQLLIDGQYVAHLSGTYRERHLEKLAEWIQTQIDERLRR
jgi:hypothetical protein